MPTGYPIWTGLSPEEHEIQYNPQAAFPDFARSRKLRDPVNAQARAELRHALDLPYGAHPLRRLDIFLAEGPGPHPVHVFFHGGYWRGQDKENFSWLAPMLVAQGITTVIANYELCPGSTLDGVVDSALCAVEWVAKNIAEHGGNPGRISISGHSAGAHLVAAVLAEDWAARGVDPAFLIGAVGVSGIYDPAPAIGTSVNTDLRLTPEIAARHDFETRPPLLRCPVSLFAGGREPWQWLDQTWRHAMHLHRHGLAPEVHVLPPYDHFDIMMDFMQPGLPIGAALIRRSLGQ